MVDPKKDPKEEPVSEERFKEAVGRLLNTPPQHKPAKKQKPVSKPRGRRSADK